MDRLDRKRRSRGEGSVGKRGVGANQRVVGKNAGRAALAPGGHAARCPSITVRPLSMTGLLLRIDGLGSVIDGFTGGVDSIAGGFGSGLTGSFDGFTGSFGGIGSSCRGFIGGFHTGGGGFLSGFDRRFLLRAGRKRQGQCESGKDHFHIHGMCNLDED